MGTPNDKNNEDYSHPEKVATTKTVINEVEGQVTVQRYRSDTYNQNDFYITKGTFSKIHQAGMEFEPNTKPVIATHNEVLGRLLYDTNKDTLAYAHPQLGAGADASPSSIKEMAAQIESKLLDPNNRGMDVTILGHASAKGDAGHNQDLSDHRAQTAYKALIAEIGKDHPELVSRIRVDSKGEGTSNLITGIDPKDVQNQNVTIAMTTHVEVDTYQVVHLNKGAINDAREFAKGTYEFGLNGSHGAVALEQGANGTIHIDLSKTPNTKDFRLLVENPNAKLSYELTAPGSHSVIVKADGHNIAVLDYNKDKPLVLADVKVGTLDRLSGETQSFAANGQIIGHGKLSGDKIADATPANPDHDKLSSLVEKHDLASLSLFQEANKQNVNAQHNGGIQQGGKSQGGAVLGA